MHFTDSGNDMALSLNQARHNVKEHPVRIWDKDMLASVKGVGRTTVQARGDSLALSRASSILGCMGLVPGAT